MRVFFRPLILFLLVPIQVFANSVGKPFEDLQTQIDELKEALAAGAPRILLDNFSLDEMRAAVQLSNGQAQLEASGGVTIDSIREIAATGVDFVSCGQITKDVHATDLSLQFAFGSKASNH